MISTTVGVLLFFRQPLFARQFGLSPARYRVSFKRKIPIPMSDGVCLMADHYRPKAAGRFPTILIRSPYGRGVGLKSPAFNFNFYGLSFAERGYQVIIQDVRGRFDSGGRFEPFIHEAADGRATLAWIGQQPWFDGRLGLWGASYLGYAQWAMADQGPPYVKALAPSVTFSQPLAALFPDEALALDTVVREMLTIEAVGRPDRGLLRSWLQLNPLRQRRKLLQAFRQLPLQTIDQTLTGQVDPVYRAGLAALEGDRAYWQAVDCRPALAGVTAPVQFVSGWYDPFLRQLLADYAALQAAGQNPHLIIGPWAHFQFGRARESLRAGMAWFERHLQGGAEPLAAEKPVRICLMGRQEWRSLAQWPPPAQPTAYFLQGNSRLGRTRPEADTPPDRYLYDPTDPTPSLGGPLLMPPWGPLDNRRLEARPDVLCYTSAPLTAPLEVIGLVRLVLFVRSSSLYTDFFGRLCAVGPDGRSINICDGLYRLRPGKGRLQPDGTIRIEVDLWATAYHFRPGHRLRLQVSSGAHPRWNRNLGTGEPLATGTNYVPARQTIYHDADHPAALWLPVVAT